MAQASEGKSRRRRRAEDAQREILDAAEALLRERPFRDVSPDDVMERTGLSRPSFYVYFRDRHELVMRVVERLDIELGDSAARWLGSAESPIEDARIALVGVVGVFADHGGVMRAIADAAAYDEQVEAAYSAMVERFVAEVAAQLGRERERERTLDFDIDQTARALVWMTERYLNDVLARDPQAEPELAAGTLHEIWVRAIYRPELLEG